MPSHRKVPAASNNGSLQPSEGERKKLHRGYKSKETQYFYELLQSTPDVREDNVEQIRRAIEDGRYKVKAEKIADKILRRNLIDRIF